MKFREGTGVRVRGGRLVTIAQADLGPLERILERYPPVIIQRVFERPEEELAREQADLAARSGRAQPDKNLYYYLVVPREVDRNQLVADLNALPVVETAYISQEANRPPVP